MVARALNNSSLTSAISNINEIGPLHERFMDCQNCELHQKRFFCANCSRTRLQEHKTKLAKIIKERQARQEQAERLLKTTEGARINRAGIFQTETHWKELRTEVDALRRANDSTRTRVAALRTQLATRRANLLSARSLSNSSYSTRPAKSTLLFPESNIDWVWSLDEVNYRLVQSRKSLVEELLEVFELAETDVSTGRLGPATNPPPNIATNAWNASGLGRHASKFGSEFFQRLPVTRKLVEPSSLRWTIGKLVLPTPAEIQMMLRKQTSPEGITSYALEEINAAIGYTLHFLGVLCFYLGIKLPFEVYWSRRKPGVGIPFLKAGPGPSNGNWARWIMPCALYLRPELASASSILPASTDSFSIAYSMLAYNVCYLAYTQTISIPLSQSGNVLANLWTLCSDDKTIGRFSHQTSSASADIEKEAAIWLPATGSGIGVSHPVHHGRLLAAPTPAPSEFPLDFDTVAQIIVGRKVEPPSESLTPGALVVEDESGEGWAVVDFEGDGM